MKEIYEYHISDIKSNFAIFHLDTLRYGETKSYNWHPNTELLYFVEGSATVHIGTDSVSASEGDVVIINSDFLHGVETEDTVRFYCFIPDRDFCELNGIDTENIVFTEKIRDGKVTELYQKLVESFCNKDVAYYDALVKNSIMNLMLYIAVNYSDINAGRPSKTAKGNEGIRLALGYIRSHIGQRMTIDELCDNAGMSKYHFVREFKRIVGDTPVVYINKLRCENAAKLLSSELMSVSEAAEQCGFESVSYFCKIFKRYIGVPPGEYEKVRM